MLIDVLFPEKSLLLSQQADHVTMIRENCTLNKSQVNLHKSTARTIYTGEQARRHTLGNIQDMFHWSLQWSLHTEQQSGQFTQVNSQDALHWSIGKTSYTGQHTGYVQHVRAWVTEHLSIYPNKLVLRKDAVNCLFVGPIN